MADPEVPGWQFEIREQSRPFLAWFSRPEPDLAFDSGYLDKDRALQRLLRRLNDYDGDIFKSAPEADSACRPQWPTNDVIGKNADT